MSYLFTSESVSEGHPDKISDQISDSILDAMLSQDPNSRVACETLTTTGLVVVAGEITTNAFVDVQEVIRETIKKIGYSKAEYKFDYNSCGIVDSLHSQSPDIAMGVDEKEDKDQGAGDQGMMFGYATTETEEYMPMALSFSHRLVNKLSDLRHNDPEKIPYLRPDAKAQVSIEYSDDHKAQRIDTVVISTQHDEFDSDEKMLKKIHDDMVNLVIKDVLPADLIDDKTNFHINPTGKFVIGGPHGDAGLTGRKIIVDTYGGRGAHGGGAFSGKDSSKVDRSAAYATRHIAKNMVASGLCEEALVQVAYAIGVTDPVSLNINTYGTAKVDMNDSQIAEKIKEVFDMRPKAIVERLGLKNPIFLPTAAGGHFGREPYKAKVPTSYVAVEETGGHRKETRTQDEKEVEFFTWEKLDHVDKIKSAFNL